MYLKNVVEKSKEVKVADRFDIGILEVMELMKAFPDRIDLAVACFRIGYLQGGKAEKKAERSKEDGKKEKN